MNEGRNRAAVSSSVVEPSIGNASLGEKEAARFDSLVNITVTSYRKRKHDPDGISVKAVLDGLVREGILPDDSTSEVKEVRFTSVICGKGEDERTVIEITDEY